MGPALGPGAQRSVPGAARKLIPQCRGRPRLVADRDSGQQLNRRIGDTLADRLRDEVNLDALREDLLVSVQQTDGPAI